MFWTRLHVYTLIPEFIIFIGLALFLSIKLKDKDEKTRMLPLTICTIILLVLEVFKQIVGIATGYDTYWIPLHFCSLFLYFHPLACFYKGKLKDVFKMIASVVSSCLFLFLLVYPNLIYGDGAIRGFWNFVTFKGGSFFDFHTVVFHGIALFTFFLFAFQELVNYDLKRDIKWIVIIYAIYCVVVGTISQLIKTNYNNFYHSNAPFLEDFRLKMVDAMGYGGQIVYVLMISIGTIIVPIIAYFVIKGIKALYHKIFG